MQFLLRNEEAYYEGSQQRTGTSLDDQCDKLLRSENNYVYRTNITAYVVIAIIAVVYVGAAFYFYTQREKVSFLTRSPLTVALSLFFLGLDSILNTLIFSGIRIGKGVFAWQCNMGIVATVMG